MEEVVNHDVLDWMYKNHWRTFWWINNDRFVWNCTKNTWSKTTYTPEQSHSHMQAKKHRIEKEIIWTKPSCLWVPAVNFPGVYWKHELFPVA